MNPAVRRPIDYDTLKKGDVLMPHQVERISGVAKTDIRAFSLALLNVKQQIERDMAARGTPVVAKVEREAIRILTDAEAVMFTAERHHSLRRQMITNHLRSIRSIDMGQLSADEQRRLENDIINRSKEIQAMQDARRQIHNSHRRNVPGLPEAREPRKDGQ